MYHQRIKPVSLFIRASKRLFLHDFFTIRSYSVGHTQQIRDPTINMIPLSAHIRTCAKDRELFHPSFFL